MKLDQEIIRDILLEIESKGVGPDQTDAIQDFHHEKLTANELSYYLWQLSDGGFIRTAEQVHDDETRRYDPCCLTYKGHEFVETIRDAQTWRQVKDAARKGGAASLDLLATLAKAYVKKAVEDRTGLSLD